MRDYNTKRREREPLIKDLFELGLTIMDIVYATGWSHPTVAKDVRRLGGEKAFPDRPRNKRETFARALQKIAELESLSWNRSGQQSSLASTLTQFIGLNDRLSVIKKMLLVQRELTFPQYEPKRIPWVCLMEDVFGERFRARPDDGPFASNEWERFLSSLGNSLPYPKSSEELDEALIKHVCKSFRPKIMPIWDKAVFKEVENLVQRLTDPERDFVNQYYGLGCPAKTMAQLGRELGLEYKVAVNLKTKIIQKLRRSARALEVVAQPVGNAVQRELAQQVEIRRLMPETPEPKTPKPIGVLFRKTDTIDFSVRTSNCFQNMMLMYMGQVVQKTENDLLRFRNFGRRSLREVKEVLAAMGLSLNMTEQDPAVARFNAYFRNH